MHSCAPDFNPTKEGGRLFNSPTWNVHARTHRTRQSFTRGHEALCLVTVGLHHQTGLRGKVQRPQHVATGQGSDKGFFGIHRSGVRRWDSHLFMPPLVHCFSIRASRPMRWYLAISRSSNSRYSLGPMVTGSNATLRYC